MIFDRYTLGEVCSFIDYRGKTPKKTSSGIPLITAKIVKNGFICKPDEFIAEEDYDSWMRRGIPRKGSVIMTTEAPLGEVARIPSDDRFAFAQRIIVLEPKQDILDAGYLYYALRDSILMGRIKSRATGTTVTGIKAAELKKVEIDCPPIETQKKVASLLSALDQYIENNESINDNLYQQLFALYDYYASTIGGEVALGTLCQFQEGYVNPAQTHPEYFDGDVKWLRAVDINESFIIETSRTLTQMGFQSAKKSAYLFSPNTIAISKSGTIGRLGIVADYMCGNRAVINIAPKNPFMLPYIYAFLKRHQKEFPDLAVGSVQKNLYVSLLEPLLVRIPDADTLSEFCNAGNAILNAVCNNCRESIRLAQLRETLLPRLMSGELDVSELDL